MFSKKLQNEPTMFLLKRMWRFSKSKKRVIIFVLFFVLANLIGLLEPIILATVINEIQQNGLTHDNFNFIALVIFSWIGITLIFWCFHGVGRYLEKENAFWVRYNYQMFLIEKVIGFDLKWHNDRQSGDSLDKCDTAYQTLYNFSKDVYRVIGVIVKVVGIIFVLSFFNIQIALFALVLVVIILYVIFLFDKRLVLKYKDLNIAKNKISAKAYDIVSNIVSIIILNIRKLVVKDMSETVLKQEKIYMETVLLIEKKWATGDILFQFVLILPLIAYLWIELESGSVVEVGTVTALYLYLSKLMGVFFGFSDLYGNLIQQKADIENATEIENNTVNKTQEKRQIQSLEDLEITALHFAYNSEREILKNIDFSFASGEKIAFIGESGSGKTTFLKLLHGLHDFNSGEAIITSLAEGFGSLKLTTLSGVDLKTTLVPQEPELFTASIRENITFGLEYSDEDVESFTDMACFTDVIQKLPNGLDSKVNEKGVNLSGGQKQRLALSRALLFAENKKIILLDESTSSVDPHNEEKIYTHILEKFAEKTIISSIHKLNLLKFFDRIVMFDNGKIVGDGTFEDLLENNTEFAKMWKSFREER